MSLPATAYTTPEALERERRALFDGGWVCVGRTALPDPRSQRAVGLLGTSVLVVRDSDGTLRAFHNVCRHRGHELLPAGGSARTHAVRCPYHGWTYRLDGTLRTAPRFDDVPDFDAATHGLVPVGVADWHGWLFVNLSGDAPPFDRHVGDLDGIVAPYAPGRLVVGAATTYEVRANWKLLHENYHECYHCPSIHPQLCRVSPPDSGENVAEPDGAWVGGTMLLAGDAETMSLDGRSGGQPLPGLTAEQRRRVSYYGLLPNLLLSLHPDYVLTHRIEPVAPDLTLVECAWLFPPEVAGDPAFDPAYAVDFWDMTNRQDWAAVESVQRGMASPGYRPGPLAPTEDGVAQFLALLRPVHGTSDDGQTTPR
jgi:glycine betaine catabolism A